MKNLILPFGIGLAILLSTFSCSSRLTRIGDFQIYGEIPDDWDDPTVNMIRLGEKNGKAFIAEVEGKRFLFFLAKERGYSRNLALAKAKLAISVNAAFALEGLTQTQIEWVEQRNSNKELIREVKKVIITYLALDVNVGGLLTHKSRIRRQYLENGSGFEAVLLMGIEYDIFTRRRDDALKRLEKEKNIPRDKLRAIQLALKELDQS